MLDAIPPFPRIHLSPEERTYYDRNADAFLTQAVSEYSNYPGYLDQHAWTQVRHHKQMSVYKSAYGVRDPNVTLMLGVGRLQGSVADIMSGIYSDSTEDLRSVRTLLKHPLVDAGVFNVSARRSDAQPYQFAGIKWFAAKAAWGMAQTRDVLAYERMGSTHDALGNELAYHVLYSIERSEWPSDRLKGIKRQNQITCYLYRRLDDESVEVFLWGTVYRLGAVSQRLAEYVAAGMWLAVVNAPRSARARKLGALAARARPSPLVVGRHCCYTCRSQSFLSPNRQCAGCSQFVCKSCSANEKIFSLDARTRQPFMRRFCRYCINQSAISEEQSFEKTVVKKRRRRTDGTEATSKSVAEPRRRHTKNEFSSARHWHNSSDASTALQFSDLSDSDLTSDDEDGELFVPKRLTAADLVSLSREPVNRKLVTVGSRTPGLQGPSEFQHYADLAVQEQEDQFHQSPDSVDDPCHLMAMSGLSHFDLQMDIKSTRYDLAADDLNCSVFAQTRRLGTQPVREDSVDDKDSFLSELYSVPRSHAPSHRHRSPN